MLSPSITATQPITPSDGIKLVRFEFPPDLSATVGYQQQQIIIPSTWPPNAMFMEAQENQPPMVDPVHSQPYPPIPAPQHTQLTVLPLQTHTFMPAKTDIHTLGTRSTKSVLSRDESSVSSATLEIVPFSNLTSSLNNISIAPVRHSNVHPKRAIYKQKRKQARVVATAGGMVVGGLTLGPAGIVVGAGVGMATNQYYKHKEKRAQQRHEQSCFQQAANESIVGRCQGAFC